MRLATVELDGEYRLLREEAGFIDRSDRGALRLDGADAAEFLQGQLTNDIEVLNANEGCYAALLDRKGHMQADMRVLCLEGGEIWIDTEPIAAETVRRHLDTYRIGRDVEIADVSGDWTITSLIGPAAAELSGAPPVAPEHAQRRFERDRLDLLAVATALGLDLISRAADAAALRDSLTRDRIAEVSAAAAEILRVEAGLPRFGQEMTAATIPEEAGINERAVSFTKGCYIGQETVARLHYKGKPNRHLRGLRLEAPARSGDPITLDGREVGSIGTAVLSPAAGPIALAIVRREASVGGRVSVAGAIDATVVALPFAR